MAKTEMTHHAPTLKLLDNGPMLLSGRLNVEYPDGRVETREGVTALCRCGQSGSKPYCDGAHKGCGFSG